MCLLSELLTKLVFYKKCKCPDKKKDALRRHSLSKKSAWGQTFLTG